MALTIRSGADGRVLERIEGDVFLNHRAGIGSLGSPASRRLVSVLDRHGHGDMPFDMITDEAILAGCRITREGGDPFTIHFTYEREQPGS